MYINNVRRYIPSALFPFVLKFFVVLLLTPKHISSESFGEERSQSASTVPFLNKCCPTDKRFDLVSKRCRLDPVRRMESTVSNFVLSHLVTFKGVDSAEHSENSTDIRYDAKVSFCTIGNLKTLTKNELPLKLSSTGHYLLWKDEDGFVLNLDKKDFCIDWTSQDEIVAQVCIPDCQLQTCVRKCCMDNEVVKVSDGDYDSCVPTNHEQSWVPTLVVEAGWTDSSGRGTPDEVFWRSGPPKCREGYYEVDVTNKTYQAKLELNGHLLFGLTGTNHSPGEFCLDQNTAYVCFGVDDELEQENDALIRKHEWRYSVFAVTQFASSFFLLVTLIIYLILWKDHSLPGWLQFCYTLSLLIAFSTLSIAQLWGPEVYDMSFQLCQVLGYTTLDSFLSVFFWLTSMNIDLWTSFRSCPMKSAMGKRKGKQKFLGFGLVSLGIPIVITGTAVYLDMKFGSLSPIGGNGSSIVEEMTATLPKMGLKTCSLSLYDKVAQLYYFYAPVGTLLLVNLGFFFCTLACLRRRQRETKMANIQSTAGDYEREKFQLFTRLFFIMGVLWIFELISFISELMDVNETFKMLFILTDFLNSLQGFFVFMLFVWKPHTRRQLKQKFLTFFWKRGLSSRSCTKSNAITSK